LPGALVVEFFGVPLGGGVGKNPASAPADIPDFRKRYRHKEKPSMEGHTRSGQGSGDIPRRNALP